MESSGWSSSGHWRSRSLEAFDLPRNCAQPGVLETLDPRHTETVVEAQNELGAQLDTASHAADQTHEIGAIIARRQEVDELDRAISCLEGSSRG